MLADFATPLTMDGFGIDHRFPPPPPPHHLDQYHSHGSFATPQLPSQPPRKRKAEVAPENNERLSKRMSYLNLEQSGPKLYVPVENPISQSYNTTNTTSPNNKPPHNHNPLIDDSQMQLDDSKHKVYIYNLDDELSSSDNDSDTAATAADNDGKLIFLPDIEKHLRNNRRIPAGVLDPRRQHHHHPSTGVGGGELAAAAAGKELVLYRVPSSLSVPEEQDSVRKAIIEARARAREKQAAAAASFCEAPPSAIMSLSSSSSLLGDVSMDAEQSLPGLGEEDPDAMELD